MKISARSEYACRALVELARSYSSQQVKQLKEIATAQAIPEKYLVHILIQLKKNGVVGSVRGANGGYYLRVPPAEISLGELVRIVDGPLLAVKSGGGDDDAQSAWEDSSELTAVWNEVGEKIAEIVDSISFADILERIRDSGRDVYQI